MDYTLYLVTDRLLARNRSIEETVVEAIKGGVTVVQLREKELTTREFLHQAFALKELTDSLSTPLIVNDRLDIALACGAAGVHLGQDDMECVVARRIGGTSLIIGVSVSTLSEALQAEREGADYLGISPVFSTATKTDAPPPIGLEGLNRIRREVRLPLVGIGGINTSNAADVVRAGANGVAVVSAIMASSDPCLAARELRSALKK